MILPCWIVENEGLLLSFPAVERQCRFFSPRGLTYSISPVHFDTGRSLCASDVKLNFENCYLDTDTPPPDTREVVFALREFSNHGTRDKSKRLVARIVAFVEYRRLPFPRSSPAPFSTWTGVTIVNFFADQSKREILTLSARSRRKEAREEPTTCDKRNQIREITFAFYRMHFRERDSSIPLVLETSTLWCIRNMYWQI